MSGIRRAVTGRALRRFSCALGRKPCTELRSNESPEAQCRFGSSCTCSSAARRHAVPRHEPDRRPEASRRVRLLKLVTVVAMLLPDCVSSDPKSRSKLVFTPLMVELIEPASCVNALLKTCAPIVPIELVAGVVVVDPVAVEEEVEELPSVLVDAMTFVAPLLGANARGPALDAPELTPAREAGRLFSMAFAGRADPDVDFVDELELKAATNWSTRLFSAPTTRSHGAR